MVNKKLLIILLTALAAFTFYSLYDHIFPRKSFLAQIAAFERAYKPTLNELTASLLKRKILDTSYTLQWRRGYAHDLLFEYLDSSGRSSGNIDIRFNLTDEQSDFFNHSGIDIIEYSKKYNCFKVWADYMTKDNERMFILIENDSSNKYKPGINFKKLDRVGNYTYYLQ